MLDRLRAFRISKEYDPITFLEMAMTARWTPEQRNAKVAAAAKLKESDKAAYTKAWEEITADDRSRPHHSLGYLGDLSR